MTPKSGFFSSEFVVTIAASIAAMWAPIRGLVPEPYQKYAVVAEIVGAGIYTICRTALKISADIKTAKLAGAVGDSTSVVDSPSVVVNNTTPAK